jgi:FlaA1/EpsC-like NDP-sugar epimerase
MAPSFQRKAVTKTARLFDMAILCLTFLAALAVSSGSVTWLSLSQVLFIRISLANLFIFVAYLVVSLLVFSGCGFYRSHRLSSRSRGIHEILNAVTILTGVLLLLRVPLQLSFATARFLVSFWLLTVAGFAVAREVSRWLLYFVRSRGRNLRNVIIIGEGPNATALAEQLSNEAGLGYRVSRIIDPTKVQEDGKVSTFG